MEKTIKVRIDTHTVTLTNAKTGEIVKEFTQTRKPTDSKVIGDFIRECKAAKVPIPPVEMTDTVVSEYREIDWSVFMANSRPVADKAETEA